MYITEYDEGRTLSLIKEEVRAEGREEGRVEGLAEGTIKTLSGMVNDALISEEKAAERAGMTLDEFRENVRKYCSK